MIRILNDEKYNFKTIFNTKTGAYVRFSDEFMASFPHLIDIGIQGHCDHGKSGLCLKAGIKCYQNGLKAHKPNMTLENYKRIIDEIKDKTFQCALGGCGDPDMHENFEEILAYSAKNHVIPNFTTSGLGMTPEKASICNAYCGAVAVSAYSRIMEEPFIAIRLRENDDEKHIYNSIHDIPIVFTLNNMNENCYVDGDKYVINNKDFEWKYVKHIKSEHLNGDYELYRVYEEKQSPNYTWNAVDMLLKAGVRTSIHYVLSNTTIDEALLRLKYNGFPAGIDAVIFLLHKPVGLGDSSDVLKYDDPRLKEFFTLVDKGDYSFKIGFDSCTIPGIINFCKNINPISLDTCEAGRYSMYITADMIALPCSFDNQAQKYAYDIKEKSIRDAWESEEFDKFRTYLRSGCKNCPKNQQCMGGCPLEPSIVLCNKKEKRTM